MKFVAGRLASHSRLNFSSSRNRAAYSVRAPIILLLSRVASNIHAIFIVTITYKLFLRVLFAEVEEGREKKKEKLRGEERQLFYGVDVKIA